MTPPHIDDQPSKFTLRRWARHARIWEYAWTRTRRRQSDLADDDYHDTVFDDPVELLKSDCHARFFAGQMAPSLATSTAEEISEIRRFLADYLDRPEAQICHANLERRRDFWDRVALWHEKEPPDPAEVVYSWLEWIAIPRYAAETARRMTKRVTEQLAAEAAVLADLLEELAEEGDLSERLTIVEQRVADRGAETDLLWEAIAAISGKLTAAEGVLHTNPLEEILRRREPPSGTDPHRRMFRMLLDNEEEGSW